MDVLCSCNLMTQHGSAKLCLYINECLFVAINLLKRMSTEVLPVYFKIHYMVTKREICSLLHFVY